MTRTIRLLLVALVALTIWPAATGLAAPGWAEGNMLWFKPGTTNLNGTLTTYKNGSIYSSMRAGSGNGQGECVKNQGRIPNGWYSTHNGHHVDNKNDTIKGRVWGLTDKVCFDGTKRTQLFIHTEETSSNEQSCPTSGDDPYCWEGDFDYASIGCVKISHPNNGYPNSVGSVHSWWHNQVAGGHATYYQKVLYVGSSAPSPPPS